MGEGPDGRRGPSLRWRLLRLVVLATVLGWGLAAALIYSQARHDVQELMDGQMAEMARLLFAQVPNDLSLPASLPANSDGLRGLEDLHGDLKMEFQVGSADGLVRLRSAHAPNAPLDGKLGYAGFEHEGQPWRSLTLESSSGAIRIQVAHPIEYRNKEALEIAQNAVLPLAFLLPIMIGLIYFSIRRGLKPLDDLAAEVGSRTSENLQPLQPAAAPLEIKPLVRALNQFLGRLDATLENERRFTADAAHELRTPLAALKVQAQIGMATKDPAQNRHALAQVVAGADRATHLVEQLLRLARLDPIVKLPSPQQFDLAELARSLVSESQAASEAQDKKIRLVVPETPVPVSGDPDLIGIALRNLIDNAMRYTPEGTAISVRAGLESGAPLLAVDDNGPGVANEELHRLAERFYRGTEAAKEGSGLGLAIVRRIAELHGARLELENARGGGFSVRLRWGGH